MEDLKNIHIGDFIRRRVIESNLDMDRIVGFMRATEEEIREMFTCSSLSSDILLRWSKLLRYDFFRLYSQHIMLYAPASRDMTSEKTPKDTLTSLPVFRKNIYTPEIIQFILELIGTGKKTKQDVMADYKIPKTTLYKWLTKYNGQVRAGKQ
ncbi:transposase [Chryseobacterium lathyri]|uniref:transposase n=1 Tax=Chryseobacterium lathyri TaxID=395933 RepID=UPI00278AEF35|nr:transposase [Chryseobacterium lathyri]MDQ0065267.1 hypothetical protein [Chryseobacterium lathyri]